MREIPELECLQAIGTRQREIPAADHDIAQHTRRSPCYLEKLLTLPWVAALVKKYIYPGTLPQKSRGEVSVIELLVIGYGLTQVIVQAADDIRVDVLA